jgi:NADPH:quinone reductase-like Zn-dependent oxidoreductase
MKAILQPQYGSPDVLRLGEVEKPVPGEEEVRVRVHAASVNRSDWEGLVGSPLYARIGGLRQPGSPLTGSDIAGIVDAVGSRVTRFRTGEAVFGEIASYRGGFAEYACAAENLLAPKPAGLTFEEAAAFPQAAVIALQGIRDKGQIRPGQQVLVNGAGGGAGTFAVQLARMYGAEVTGVDNAEKLDLVRSLGAEHVINYTREDFTCTGRRYDFILDLVAERSVFAYRRALAPHGRYEMVGGSMATLFQVLLLGSWVGRAEGKSIHLLAVRRNPEDLLTMAGLYEAGKIRPVIDRCFSLEEVPAALRYLGEGHALGKIVIRVAEG